MGLTVRQNENSPFKFDQQKAIQAVAFLLKQRHSTPKTDSYMRLLKLLYIADRESLQETGQPITGDKYIAMDRGPTLSHLLDLVRQKAYDSSEWDKFIERNGYEITLVADPGNGKLCKYEIDKLTDICNRFRDKDEWATAEETHKFEEWEKNKPAPGSVKDIPLLSLLEAIGKKDWYEAVVEDAQDEADFTHRFQGT